MQWFHWWDYWHHVTLMPTQGAAHDQKVMLHLSDTAGCLNLRNVLVPLTMLLVAYDTNASANGVKLSQSHIEPHLSCPDPRNAVVPLTTLSVSYDARAGTNGVT